MNRALKNSHRWLCWLPLASLLAVEIYVDRFDGWGAWSAAPLLLIPGAISLVVAVPMLVQGFREARAGTRHVATVLYLVIAALPLLWLSVRRFFV